MNVLLTGGNGFVGSHIAEALAADGQPLRLLLRRNSRLTNLQGIEYERFEGDVRNTALISDAVKGIDVVVHVAGLTRARREADYVAVNAEGTAALVRAARDAGVGRFVYVSSLAAQGPSPDGDVVPPELPRPISAYGRSKLAGELSVLAASERMNVVVVRLPAVYGPRDRDFLPLFRLIKRRMMPLYGDGMNRVSWVNVLDAASAIALATTGPVRSASVYTIADGEPHTWRELAETLARVLNKRVLMLKVPPVLYSCAARMGGLASMVTRRPLPLNPEKLAELRQRHWVCDYRRIGEELGWRPVLDAQAGLALTVQWYREHRWL